MGPKETQKLFDYLECSYGGHGNGVAFIKNGKVHIRKSVSFTVSEAVKLAFNSGVEWFLFHTRFASVGDISKKNCHPFRYGRVVAAMNGTESGLRSLTEAMGNITDTEASIISISAVSGNISSEDIVKRINKLDSVFVGFIRSRVKPRSSWARM